MTERLEACLRHEWVEEMRQEEAQRWAKIMMKKSSKRNVVPKSINSGNRKGANVGKVNSTGKKPNLNKLQTEPPPVAIGSIPERGSAISTSSDFMDQQELDEVPSSSITQTVSESGGTNLISSTVIITRKQQKANSKSRSSSLRVSEGVSPGQMEDQVKKSWGSSHASGRLKLKRGSSNGTNSESRDRI